MRSTLRVVGGQGGAFAVQVLATALIAKGLGPAGQGSFAIARTGVVLGEAVLWLGLNSGFSYLVARDWQKSFRTLYIASLLHLVVTTAMLVFFGCLYQQFSDNFSTWVPAKVMSAGEGIASYKWPLFGWLVVWSLFQLHYRALMSLHDFELANILNLLNGGLVVVWVLVFPAAISLLNVIYVQIAALGVGICVSFLWLSARLQASQHARRVWPQAVEGYTIGSNGLVSTFAFLALYRVDLIFVGHFCGAAETGRYAVASFAVEAVQRVSDWLAAILAPRVATGMKNPLQRAWRYAQYGALVVLALGIVLAVLRVLGFSPIVTLVGQGYSGVELLVLALVPRGILHAIMVSFAGILSGRGYTFYHPLAGILALLVLVGCDAILVARLGTFGAAIGITFAYIVAATGMFIGARRTEPKESCR